MQCNGRTKTSTSEGFANRRICPLLYDPSIVGVILYHIPNDRGMTLLLFLAQAALYLHCWLTHWLYWIWSLPGHTKPNQSSTTQTLTRVSISRKSGREMTHIFLSRSREMKFHFSFSSQFSRFLENISLSLLDFSANEETFLVLLSIDEIPVHISLFPLVRNAKFRRKNSISRVKNFGLKRQV